MKRLSLILIFLLMLLMTERTLFAQTSTFPATEHCTPSVITLSIQGTMFTVNLNCTAIIRNTHALDFPIGTRVQYTDWRGNGPYYGVVTGYQMTVAPDYSVTWDYMIAYDSYPVNFQVREMAVAEGLVKAA